jgi:hypothetical protein
LQVAIVSGTIKISGKSPLQIINNKDSIHINTGVFTCTLPKNGNSIIASLRINEKLIAENGQLQCILQDKPDGDLEHTPTKEKLTGIIEQINIEQSGPLRAVVRINGHFINNRSGKKSLPFITRLYFYAGVQSIRMVYTFIYDGDAQKDFVKGLGLNITDMYVLAERKMGFGPNPYNH